MTPTDSTAAAASIVAVALLGIVTLFQFALALGAPWGQAAWGGGHRGVLPAGYRVASGVVAVVIYPLIAMVIVVTAGTVRVAGLSAAGSAAMWVLTGFFALGAVANLASRSKVERIWSPVSSVVAVCCGIIASGL
ncbi:MAG: hypothetical protein WD269_01195 [Acidimicrobiia bacterium]